MVTVLFVWLCVHTALVLAGLIVTITDIVRSDSQVSVRSVVGISAFIIVFPGLFWALWALFYFNRGGLGGWI
ncbi:hypothetical protein ABEW32_05005 [Paenibacillus jamilae]|uniref:hypothetical protein n=1 Tax=Paenibacillus jamilae TaxID=114136 RepID=UPI003D281185